jgi:MFS transporter, SET family, sugar efflux transporter
VVRWFMKDWAARFRHMLAKKDFVGLLASTLALGMGFSFVSPFMSLWGLTELGLSAWQFGLFMTAMSLSSVGVGLALARFSDTRISRKAILVAGALAGVLGYAGYAYIRQPWLLVLIAVTLIALASVCFSQLFASVRERYAGEGVLSEEAGVTMGVVRACFSVAWMAGPAIGAALMVRYGFTTLFMGAAGLYLLFLLGVIRFVPHQPRTEPVSMAARVPMWRSLRRPDLLACFVAFVLIFAAFAMNMMNLPIAVMQVLGGTGGDLGIIFAVGPVVELPLMLWFGLLAARGHQLRLIRLGAAAGVLYFAFILFAQAPWQVYFIQALAGVVFAIITNVAIVFFQDLLPGQAGLATTVFTNSSQIGNLLGFLGFGFLADAIGSRGLFAVGLAATIGTFVIMMFFRPRPAHSVPLAAEGLAFQATPAARQPGSCVGGGGR